ncbi:hypothetical protein F9L05_14635 [Brucella anthropi]|nr:hypothetical protein F9L05_14635 [Brucella anthropi]
MAKFDRPRIRRKGVPEYLREVHGVDISLATLNAMATRGDRPTMQYMGWIPLYHKNDLDTWVTERLSAPVRSTSERSINRQ